jgi:hypothetical protein
MAPELLLSASWLSRSDPRDGAAIRNAFLDTFRRLLTHPAPVAQYAALHGLGHLEHDLRPQVIDAYIARHPDLPAAQREYSERARSGEVL